MTAPTTRLGDVEPGTHVVLDGEVGHYHRHWGSHCVNVGETCNIADRDTPVLVLEGTAPRPLRECEGRDVWAPEFKDVVRVTTNNSAALVWPIAHPEPQAEAEAARWEAINTGDGWAIVDEDDSVALPKFATDEYDDARALADHINTSAPDGGPWVPEPPEPERLIPSQILNGVIDNIPNVRFLSTDPERLLGEHGYEIHDTRDPHVRLVRTDTPEMVEAVGWLRRMSNVRSQHVPRHLLDALGLAHNESSNEPCSQEKQDG